MNNMEGKQYKDIYPDRLLDGRVFREVTAKTIDLALKSYKTSRILNITSFIIGVSLLVSAILVGFIDADRLWLSVALGAFGTIDLVVLLITKPVERIQLGINDLLQAQISSLNFAASYEALARYLIAASELGFDDTNRDIDKEFERAKFLMNSAITAIGIENSGLLEVGSA